MNGHAMDQWIASKPRNFFADGIQKLPERWKRCVDNNRDYFEHLTDHDIEEMSIITTFFTLLLQNGQNLVSNPVSHLNH